MTWVGRGAGVRVLVGGTGLVVGFEVGLVVAPEVGTLVGPDVGSIGAGVGSRVGSAPSVVLMTTGSTGSSAPLEGERRAASTADSSTATTAIAV